MHSEGSRRKRLGMRARVGWLGALLGGFLLVVTGCAGYDTDPGVENHAPSGSLRDVSTKINYMKRDHCFTAPMQHGSARCDRYLEQVKNLASVSTGTNASEPVRHAGNALGQRIRELQAQSCLPPQPGSEHRCAMSLAEVDRALVELGDRVAAQEQQPPG